MIDTSWLNLFKFLWWCNIDDSARWCNHLNYLTFWGCASHCVGWFLVFYFRIILFWPQVYVSIQQHLTTTRRSHTPPKWEECGKLKNHTTPLLRRHSFTGTSSHQRSKRWGWTRMGAPHWSDQACPWFHAVALEIPPESLMHKLLTTFLAQTSAILNNRPLIPVSTDPEDPLPLGPSLRWNNIHGKGHSN